MKLTKNNGLDPANRKDFYVERLPRQPIPPWPNSVCGGIEGLPWEQKSISRNILWIQPTAILNGQAIIVGRIAEK